MPIDLTTPEQRADFLVSHDIKGFVLFKYEEFDVFKKIYQQSIIDKLLLSQVEKDSRRLNLIEVMMFEYKFSVVEKDGAAFWGYSSESKNYGPFPDIRTMLDDLLLKLNTKNETSN